MAEGKSKCLKLFTFEIFVIKLEVTLMSQDLKKKKDEEADQKLYIDIIFLKQEPNIVNVVFEDRSI